MKWIIRAYALTLLAYTGWRTWDFVRLQLPSDDVGFFLAILFLFSAEAGLLIWHELSINHTTTYTQHNLAVWMTWLCFVASVGAGVADMIIRQTLIGDYVIPSWLAMALIIGLPLVVAANVAATLVYMANDAEAQLDQQTRFLDFEARKQAIKQMAQNRAGLVKSRKSELYATMTRGYEADINTINGSPQPPVQPNPTTARKRKV